MNPIALDGPTVEPVSLGEAKAHLRFDGADEDDLLASFVSAARLMIEAATRLVLVRQPWRLTLRCWPRDGTVALPLAPVMAIDAVRVADAWGQALVLDPALYRLDASGDPARVLVDVAAAGPPARSGRIEIDLSCGFGDGAESVPAPLRLAIRLLVAHWHGNRGDASDPAGGGLPPDVRALIAPFTRRRLA